jgi:hypothetical protein
MPPTTDLILGAVLLFLAAVAALGAYALRARNRAVEDYNQRKERRLVLSWKPETIENLKAFHTMDAEKELIDHMTKEVALEIDREILANQPKRDLLKRPGPPANHLSNKISEKINEELRADLEKFEEEKLADIGASTTVKKCMTCKATTCDCQLEMNV